MRTVRYSERLRARGSLQPRTPPPVRGGYDRDSELHGGGGMKRAEHGTDGLSIPWGVGARMACTHSKRSLTSSFFAAMMESGRVLRNSRWEDASP